MTSFAIMMLLAVASQGIPAAQSRENYAKCLQNFVEASAEKKMETAAFEAALAGVCRDEESGFKNAMIASEVKLGIRRADAEAGLQQEIVDYRSAAKEDFQAASAIPKI